MVDDLLSFRRALRGYRSGMPSRHPLPGLEDLLDEVFVADERVSRDEIVRRATAADLPAATLSRLDALPEGEYAYDEVLDAVQVLDD
jgi:hypothetical protein